MISNLDFVKFASVPGLLPVVYAKISKVRFPYFQTPMDLNDAAFSRNDAHIVNLYIYIYLPWKSRLPRLLSFTAVNLPMGLPRLLQKNPANYRLAAETLVHGLFFSFLLKALSQGCSQLSPQRSVQGCS